MVGEVNSQKSLSFNIVDQNTSGTQEKVLSSEYNVEPVESEINSPDQSSYVALDDS